CQRPRDICISIASDDRAGTVDCVFEMGLRSHSNSQRKKNFLDA
nr:hypothetical protein [Tanacetum cinerariifolium]